MPLHARSAGRVLLAFDPEAIAVLGGRPLPSMTAETVIDPGAIAALLEQTRQRGYAISIGESDQGVSSISAPVTNAQGEVAALSIVAPTEWLTGQGQGEQTESVRTAAAQPVGMTPALNTTTVLSGASSPSRSASRR